MKSIYSKNIHQNNCTKKKKKKKICSERSLKFLMNYKAQQKISTELEGQKKNPSSGC